MGGIIPHRVKLSELAAMDQSEFKAATATLVRAQKRARTEGSPALDARIRQFENRYEMSSEELLERVRTGKQRETAEICEWLLLLAARDPGPRAIR